MGRPKKANRKAADDPQISTEACTARQTIENVMKNKKRSLDSRKERRINHDNVVLALAATGENGEASPGTKKKRTGKKSSKASKNNNVDQKLVEETASLQTADQSGVTEDDTSNTIKTKRKRKRPTESQNNDPDEISPGKPSSDENDTGKKIKPDKKRKNCIEPKNSGPDVTAQVKEEKSLSDVISKKKKVVLVCKDQEIDRPSTSGKIDTSPTTMSDLPTENNLVSDDETISLLKYRRKKKKLADSCEAQLLQSKEQSPSLSLQVPETSSKKSKRSHKSEKLPVMDVSVSMSSADNCDPASKKKRKKNKRKEMLSEVSNSVDEPQLEKSEDTKGLCSLGGDSPKEKLPVMDVSVSMSSADNCDLASKKKRKKNKRKEMLSEVSNSVDEPQIEQSEDTKVHCSLGGDSPKEGPNVFGEEIPAVSVAEHNKEELIPLLASKSGIKGSRVDEGNAPLERSNKERCSSLLSAVADVSSCNNAVNDLDHAHSNRRKRRKNGIHATNEDKPSDSMLICDPSANQVARGNESCVIVDGNLTGDASPLLGETNVDAKKILVCGGENFDISPKAGQMEEETGHVLTVNIPSPVQTPSSCTRKKLLVLDLNGILVDIVSDVPDGYKADTFIARKALFKRPFCDDFLKFLFQNFDVGVWSSRTKRNVDSVVDFVMGDMKKNLLFCWDQYHCTDTGYSTIENRQKPLVLKELKKLWNKDDQNLPWEKGAYNESNTILLDDSPYKALRNPTNTAIFPPPYRFEDAGDKSLGPGGDLRVYLEGLLKADDVQNYVEQHRFGQRAITDKNSSWGFYLRIIGKNAQTRTDIGSSSRLQMGSTC